MAPLTLTGERTLPGIVAENYWFRRHEAAYRIVAPACVGATVIEAGCGEGYGAELLRRSGARQVLALDYDAAVVSHVRRRYPDVIALRANVVRLPCRSATVDAVVALQVIEHLWEQPRFVRECARVLHPGGVLLLTTPNRVTFAPADAIRNPFHTREMSADELSELVSPYFRVSMRGLHHSARLRQWEATHGSLVKQQLATESPTWPPALCTQVSGVRVEDFELNADTDAALDLVLVGLRR